MALKTPPQKKSPVGLRLVLDSDGNVLAIMIYLNNYGLGTFLRNFENFDGKCFFFYLICYILLIICNAHVS